MKLLLFNLRGAVLTRIVTLSGHWPVEILTHPPHFFPALRGANIVDLFECKQITRTEVSSPRTHLATTWQSEKG